MKWYTELEAALSQKNDFHFFFSSAGKTSKNIGVLSIDTSPKRPEAFQHEATRIIRKQIYFTYIWALQLSDIYLC